MKLSISRGIASILGRDLRFEGSLVSQGEVFVLGMLTGTVSASKLTIEKGGTVDGNVEAQAVVIDGHFSGSLAASSVSLGRTASVNADITYVAMEMHAGAVHCGQSRHVDSIKAKTASGRGSGPVLELIHRAPETA